MSLGMFQLIAAGLLTATYLGLTIASKIRERRDAKLTEATSGRWRIRAQIPLPAPDPYLRFGILEAAMILNTMEGTDEGFEVAYFDAYIKRGHGREHGAIVDLPVEGPTLDPRTPVSERRAIGPRTSSRPWRAWTSTARPSPSSSTRLNRPPPFNKPPSASPTPSSPTRKPTIDFGHAHERHDAR
jgi:hypothetical protein